MNVVNNVILGGVELFSKNEYTFWKYGHPRFEYDIYSHATNLTNTQIPHQLYYPAWTSVNPVLVTGTDKYKLTVTGYTSLDLYDGKATGYWVNARTGNLYLLGEFVSYIGNGESAIYKTVDEYRIFYPANQMDGIACDTSPTKYPNGANYDGKWFEKITL